MKLKCHRGTVSFVKMGTVETLLYLMR